ncbi:MAG: hypothetical protein IPO07_10970 [Haliscomenobacter sp.]|nr:hypothetical protein [Haliscomenobacter sp.]MBK9489248.1 hypothetical protein [Haliscomenobacter sp.]
MQDDIFKDLKNGLPVANPTAGIDSILGAWSGGRADLNTFLLGNPKEFDALEIERILGAYDQANAGWIEKLQVIQTGFTQFKDIRKLTLLPLPKPKLPTTPILY